MSSPKVLTAVQMPAEMALAANREDISYYLELARTVLKQIELVEQQILDIGGSLLPRDTISIEQAEAEAWRRFRQDGYSGTKYAHAYWQAVKHPWQEQVVRRYGQAVAELNERKEQERQALEQEEERQQQEQQDLKDTAAQIRSDFRSAQEFTIQQINAPDCKPVFSLPQQIAADKAAIRQMASSEEKSEIEAQIQQWEGQELHRQSIALESLRLTMEQRGKQNRTEQAVQAYQEMQRKLTAERMEWHLSRCIRQLQDLESTHLTPLQMEVEHVQSEMEHGLISLEGEEHLQELELRITNATRQQGLLEAAITSLRRQGYEKIEVSQMIGPPSITSVYLHDPRDHNRVALVQSCDEKGLLAAEIVRRGISDGSQQERSRDQEAQERLCHAMDAAEQALAEKWRCTVVKNEKPGTVPKVKTDIPRKGIRNAVQGSTIQRTLI